MRSTVTLLAAASLLAGCAPIISGTTDDIAGAIIDTSTGAATGYDAETTVVLVSSPAT